MPRIWLLLAVIGVTLAGCVPTSALRMDDLYIYGIENARLTYFYGEAGQILYDGGSLSLAEQPESAVPTGNYVVRGALVAAGKPFLRVAVDPLPVEPVVVSRIPFTTDLQVALKTDVDEVVYYDGQSFLRLLETDEAGTVRPVVPRPRLNGLRGLGQLTNAEADALAAALTAGGRPFALAALPIASLPSHAVDGLSEHRRTGIYVQREIATDASAYRPTPERLTWDVVARGDQAVGFASASYQLVTSQDELISLWQRAYGSRLTVPALPSLDFRRETIIALFMGSRSSGGYSMDVTDVREEGGELYVELQVTEPAPGTITTQALTSPWLILRVQRGGYAAAWLRDTGSGNLLGVARADR